jgi:hypothetical protein
LLPGDNPTFPATHSELIERYRAAGQERHGVSTVTAGTRTALGVIFHDAQ